MPQTLAEKKKQAYLHQLKNTHQLSGYVIKSGKPEKVQINNPHLVEKDGKFMVQGDYQGHMVSRFVRPPPK